MITATLIKIAASLIAILALAGLARWLRLGGDARISDTAHAIALARESMFGFEGVDAAVDRAGYAALVRDAANRHLLVRSHGVHFAARLLTAPVNGRLDQKFLTIAIGDPDFAPVTLNLGEAAQHWASGLRRLTHG